MLGPATVALAIPIYEKKNLILKEIKPIIFAIFLGIPFAILVTFYLAKFFNLNQDIILTMIPRNVTAPIAMGIAELIGGIPSSDSYNYNNNRDNRCISWNLCTQHI